MKTPCDHGSHRGWKSERGWRRYFFVLVFAQRSFCAAEILARAAALILRFTGAVDLAGEVEDAPPKSRPSSACKPSILAWILAARCSCFAVNDVVMILVSICYE
jgi:hypothetical protein